MPKIVSDLRCVFKRFRNKNHIFWKFIQFSSKQRYFLCALPTWVDGKGVLPTTIPGTATTGSQRSKVNDEPRKILNLLFFVYFFAKWAKIFNKLQFFTFEQMQYMYSMLSPGKILSLLFFVCFFRKWAGQRYFLRTLPTWVQGREICLR